MFAQFTPYRPHYRALISLGTPLIIGQIGIILQNFADTLMIGHHSTQELAAASLVSNIFMLGILMAMGFALCLTPLIGRDYGQGDLGGIGRTLKNGMVLNTLVALVLMAAYTVIYFLLGHMGQPAELLPLIRPYFIINLVSLPFVCWVNALKQLFDATTRTQVPMWVLVGGNALNILGNWLLIYGVAGIPEMGLAGAGLSTLLARIVMCVVIFVAYRRSAYYADVRRATRQARVSRPVLRRLAAIGLPISLQMGMESGAWSLCSIIVGWIGTTALAGHQIMLTISQLFFQFYYALASAVSIRISLFVGQHNLPAIHRCMWAGCHLNLLIAVIVTLPVVMLRQELAYLFTDSAQVAQVVAASITPLIVYQISDGLQITFSNALRGLAYVRPMIQVAFISYFVISLPLAYLLGIPMGYGLEGVWYSFPFGLTAAALQYYYFYRRKLHQLQQA